MREYNLPIPPFPHSLCSLPLVTAYCPLSTATLPPSHPIARASGATWPNCSAALRSVR